MDMSLLWMMAGVYLLVGAATVAGADFRTRLTGVKGVFATTLAALTVAFLWPAFSRFSV